MNGFIIAPLKNRPGFNDAIGAFHVGAPWFQKIHALPAPVYFDNEGSPEAVSTRFLKALDDAPGGWDVFAYFGHGDNTCLASAHVYGHYGAGKLAEKFRAKANAGVKVLLYACNTGIENGFASMLADELADLGAEVYAHVPPPGHTFANPNVIVYPDGERILPRNHRLWTEWVNDIRDQSNDLWARFPFMTRDELEAELEAPEYLIGRWEVKGKDLTRHEVFFDDKSAVRTDPATRYAVQESGTWKVEHGRLQVAWDGGDAADWPLRLTPRRQNVRVRGDGGMTAFISKRIEAPNVNQRGFFLAE